MCAMMACVLPVSVSSQSQAELAMLYTQGGVHLNGVPPPAAIAIFPGDLVQTERDSVAKLTASGSGVTIQPETVVSFEGNAVRLDHGSVSVDTSQAFAVRVGCLTIIPVRMDGTQYEVTDVNGTVTVNARKSDVNVNHRTPERKAAHENHSEENNQAEQVTVREGEQRKREDKCAAAALPGQSAAVGLKGPLLNSLWAKTAGAGGIAVLACWVLCRTEDPISPNKP
jgi:hypothetical protein